MTHGRTYYLNGSWTTTEVYSDFVYDDNNRIVSYTCKNPSNSINDNSISITYTREAITCVMSYPNFDETFVYHLSGNRILSEDWDGSSLTYDYADSKLTSIVDGGYASATYSWNVDGSLKSFIRTKRNDTGTTEFSYPSEPKTCNGPLLWVDLGDVDPFCMEGTDCNWALQLSGYFIEVGFKQLPDQACYTRANSDPINYTIEAVQDEQGYVTELKVVKSQYTYDTLTFVWE